MGLFASQGRSAYRNVSGVWLVELRLRELRQLFNHLDPAPFREKDLDPEAESYIDGAVREIGLHKRKKLLIHLPATVAASHEALACRMPSRTTSSTAHGRRASSFAA